MPKWRFSKSGSSGLYTGRVFFSSKDCVGINVDSQQCFPEFRRWKSIYSLGDFLQDSDFKDAAVNALVDSMIELGRFPYHMASYIYPASTVGSAHRTLATDVYINCWQRDQWGS